MSNNGTNNEEWRPVVGYEGLYEVSSTGDVRSLDKYIPCGYESRGKRLQRGKILKPYLNAHGYYTVALCNGGPKKEQRTRSVHQIVTEAFVGPRPSESHGVNHKDGNKANNDARNLEWVTAAENTKHAQASGLILQGEKISTSKLTESDVRKIRHLRNQGAPLLEIAQRFGVAESTACQIALHRTWKHV
jgi:hypothetical protein